MTEEEKKARISARHKIYYRENKGNWQTDSYIYKRKAYNKTERGKEVHRNKNFRDNGILNGDGSQFTMNDYRRHFKLQEGRCALKSCNKHQSGLEKVLVADHNHATGIFRGLLCNDCNRLLVSIHTLETAKALVIYLTQYSTGC